MFLILFGYSTDIRSTFAFSRNGQQLAVTAVVIDPNGQSVGDNDMQGNSETENTRAGDYLIVVAPSLKDSRHQGSFCVNVSVTKYQAGSSLFIPTRFNQLEARIAGKSRH
jgi:hypothetical protein